MSHHRSRVALLLAIVLVAAVPSVSAAALGGRGTSALPGGWSAVQGIPRFGRLDTGGAVPDAVPVMAGVSCTALGACAAAGNYATAGGVVLPFVVDERGGRWGDAARVRGLASLVGTGGGAVLEAISCARSGACVAGGFATEPSGAERAFVLDEVGGRWGRATRVAVPAIPHRDSGITAVSCAAPSDCTAVGDVGDAGIGGGSSGPQQVFVVGEHAGAWGRAAILPGSRPLNGGAFDQLDALSCSAPGTCVTGGSFSTRGGALVPMLAVERGGRWGRAMVVAGYRRLRATGNEGDVDSISCVAGGGCSAVGWFSPRRPFTRAFGVTEIGGSWRAAVVLARPRSSVAGGFGDAASVACGAPSSCSAVGTEATSALDAVAFVAATSGGTWGASRALPRSTVLGGANVASASSISCASAAVCIAVGSVTSVSGASQALVDQESGRVWRPSRIAPRSERLNTGGDAALVASSCSARGYCAAVGTYAAAHDGRVAMVENFRS